MSEGAPVLIVIAGPTASGKTSLALNLARGLNAELVGADSVQVYRGFDVGSAKPTAAELGDIRHHMIDVLDPNEDIDAAGYAKLADAAIEEIAARGKLPIVVGGTGLWIRALLRGLVSVPPVDPDVRARLEGEVEAHGSEALHARLQEVDPITGANVHPNDALRIVRALEVYQQTGRPLGALRREHALGAPRYRAHMLFLDPSGDWLDPRIETRIDDMFAAGFVEEVSRILERWGHDVRALGSVGYREVVEHLRDGVPLDETKRRIRKSTRLYARRQRTWFRTHPDVTWTLPIDAETGDVTADASVRIHKAVAR